MRACLSARAAPMAVAFAVSHLLLGQISSPSGLFCVAGVKTGLPSADNLEYEGERLAKRAKTTGLHQPTQQELGSSSSSAAHLDVPAEPTTKERHRSGSVTAAPAALEKQRPFRDPLFHDMPHPDGAQWAFPAAATRPYWDQLWATKQVREVGCGDVGFVYVLDEPREMFFHHGTRTPRGGSIQMHGANGSLNGRGIYVTPRFETAQAYGQVAELRVAVKTILFLDESTPGILQIRPDRFRTEAPECAREFGVADRGLGGGRYLLENWGNIDLVLHGDNKNGRQGLVVRFYDEEGNVFRVDRRELSSGREGEDVGDHVVKYESGVIPARRIRWHGEYDTCTEEDLRIGFGTFRQIAQEDKRRQLSRRVLATKMAMDAIEWSYWGRD